MKLDRLILKKIIKIVATRCHILRQKCTKFDFGWGSLQRSPRPPSCIKGALLLRGREGRGEEGEGEERGEEEEGKGEGEGKGGSCPGPRAC